MVAFLSFPFLLVSSIILWLAYGVPSLVLLSNIVAGWCRNIFMQCVEYAQIVGFISLWMGTALLVTGVIYSIFKAARTLIKTHAALRRLPVSGNAGSIRLIRDEKVKVAFTCGIIRPTIYMSTGLFRTLTHAELKAVFFHELHHKKRRDPLRSFVGEFVKDLFFYLPIGKYLVKRNNFIREWLADDSAVQSSKDDFCLPKALIKLARYGNGYLFNAGFVSIRGGGSVEGRIKRIIEKKDVRPAPPSRKIVVSTAFIAILIMVSLSTPLFAGVMGSMRGCKMGDCSRIKMNNISMYDAKHCSRPVN